MSLYNSSRHQDHILSRHAQSPPSFTINLHPEHWLINNSRPNLYHTPISFLLDEVRERRIPPDWLQAFDQHGVTFYDGCLIVELVDHRANDKPPTRERVLLPLDPESLWNDIRLLQEKALLQSGKPMSDYEALELEARILAATSPPLCLDPDPIVSRIVNTALRTSVLPAPAALRKKDLTVDNDRDTAMKARLTKIMSLFNPHKSRISQPSTRLLEIIQGKQASASGQANSLNSSTAPNATPSVAPNASAAPQGAALKKKPTLTLKPPKMEDGTPLSAVNSAADDASNQGSAHQTKRKASTSEQVTQPPPKKKMSKKNDGSVEQSPALPQTNLPIAAPQQVNQPPQSVAYPLPPNPAAAVYAKANPKKASTPGNALAVNAQNRQQKMEANAEASRQTPVDPVLKNPVAVLQANLARANTPQAQAAYAAAAQTGQTKPSTPQPAQIPPPVQQNMPLQHNPFMQPNQQFNPATYSQLRQAYQAAQAGGQAQPAGAQQYQASQTKFPQVAQFTFPPQFNMQNMAQYQNQLDAARILAANAAARTGTPNMMTQAQTQGQFQSQAQAQLQAQQPPQPPGAMPQMVPQSRSPFQPQQVQSSPQLQTQSPNITNAQAQQNALRAASTYSQSNPPNNAQLHPYAQNPALLQQLRQQQLQQHQFQQQLQAQQVQQASQQQQQQPPQPQQFGMQIAPSANFQLQLPARAHAAQTMNGQPQAGWPIDPARAQQILAAQRNMAQQAMAQQAAAASMGRGMPGAGRGQPRQ